MSEHGPVVTPDGVTFRLPAEPDLRPLRVWFHLRDFGADPRFRREGGDWVARIPPPPVDRLEYLIVAEEDNGDHIMAPDPTNPLRTRGVFGDHSLIEFPGYAAPTWIREPEPVGLAHPVEAMDEASGIVAGGVVWNPEPHSQRDSLPLVVVHDGPEYADLAGLLRFLAARHGAGAALPRVLLLHPQDRDRSYSASPGYTRALVDLLLPRVLADFPSEDGVTGVGASLGAVALAHAQVARPGVFAGLLLQSGSFFADRYDAHEHRFRFYQRLLRFTGDLWNDPAGLATARVVMTCGTGEENLDNNRALHRRLAAHGMDVPLIEHRDAHNYTSWRDVLDPALADLLAAVWRRAGDE